MPKKLKKVPTEELWSKLIAIMETRKSLWLPDWRTIEFTSGSKSVCYYNSEGKVMREFYPLGSIIKEEKFSCGGSVVKISRKEAKKTFAIILLNTSVSLLAESLEAVGYNKMYLVPLLLESSSHGS
jgi:hypothetical protein